jgi:regulator of sirC expression with transglutaminase-like and TPR domain
MIKVAAFVLALMALTSNGYAAKTLFTNPVLEAKIETLFRADRDLADVRATVDQIARPDFPAKVTLKQIDDLTTKLKALLPTNPSTSDKLATLKKFIYVSGSWNDNRPFAYDLADPSGKEMRNRILSSYITTRSGNCVSMPTLFVILGNRIGLKLTMAVAPSHEFVKFTDDNGREWNIEATSGAGFARDVKYRTDLPMTDLSVTKGTYMRALSHEETVALMAVVVVEQLLHDKKPKEAVVVIGVLLKHYPNSAELLILQAGAYAMVLDQDISPFYRHNNEMPPDVQAYADAMYQGNQIAFNEALELGYSENHGKPGVQP